MSYVSRNYERWDRNEASWSWKRLGTPNSDVGRKWGSSIVSSGELSLRRLKIDRWVLVACFFACSVVSPPLLPFGRFCGSERKFILAGTVHWSDNDRSSESVSAAEHWQTRILDIHLRIFGYSIL